MPCGFAVKIRAELQLTPRRGLEMLSVGPRSLRGHLAVLLVCGRPKCSELNFSINYSSCSYPAERKGHRLWNITIASVLTSSRWTQDWGTNPGTEVFFLPGNIFGEAGDTSKCRKIKIPATGALQRAFPPTVHFESLSAAPDQLFRPVHSLNSVFIFYQRNMRTQFKESDSCMKLDKKKVFFDPPLSEAIISCYFGWFFS